MTKKIKRFPLEITPQQTLKIPWNSEILSFNNFEGIPGINAIVDVGQKDTERSLLITTLDKELPLTVNATKYVGSFTSLDGKNIFFVFEQ